MVPREVYLARMSRLRGFPGIEEVFLEAPEERNKQLCAIDCMCRFEEYGLSLFLPDKSLDEIWNQECCSFCGKELDKCDTARDFTLDLRRGSAKGFRGVTIPSTEAIVLACWECARKHEEAEWRCSD